jgi:hypothetical protein
VGVLRINIIRMTEPILIDSQGYQEVLEQERFLEIIGGDDSRGRCDRCADVSPKSTWTFDIVKHDQVTSLVINRNPSNTEPNKLLCIPGVYVETHAVHCLTPNDRPPTKEELFTCSLSKRREIECYPNLRYIFLLGDDATQQFFGLGFPSIVKVFGNVYLYPKRKFIIIPLYHPLVYDRESRMFKQEYDSVLSQVDKLIRQDQEGKLAW